MIEKVSVQSDLTPDYFMSILDAVHIEGPMGNTEYSTVIDLKKGLIYVTHWHQYGETAILNIKEEISKVANTGETQSSPILIASLFSKSTVQLAENEHRQYNSGETR